MLARFNGDGSTDLSFGTAGFSITGYCPGSGREEFHTMLLLPGGRILAAGAYAECAGSGAAYLMRFLADGSPDAAFSADPWVISPDMDRLLWPEAMALQPDGKLLLGIREQITFEYDPDINYAYIARYHGGITIGSDTPMADDAHFSMLPNPVADEDVVVSFHLPSAADITLEMFDISGRMIQPFYANERMPEGTHKLELKLKSGLAPGIYLVRFSDGSTNISRRLLKL
jgi:hypothetical protein